MKLKKVVKVLLGCVLAGFICAGCGGLDDSPIPKKDPSSVKVGILTHLNASEEKINELMKKVENVASRSPRLSKDYTYYDKLIAMQMGLETGSIQEMSIYKSVANYLMAGNDRLAIANDIGEPLADSFCFAVREDETMLKSDLDMVINDMRADGALDKLVDSYIHSPDQGADPAPVQIPYISGAPSLKVAITGDLPPIDFVLADGSPAGFNTAVLAEVGKRLRRNIELVPIDSGARATALASKKVDVVFWAVVPVDSSIMPVDMDKPSGVELSVPYFKDDIVHVERK